MTEIIQINAGPEAILPSGLLALCEPLNCEDQANLLNMAKTGSGESMDEIISKRVKIGGKAITVSEARDLLEADRMAICIHLRRLSFGDLMDLNMQCPECNKKYKTTITLDDENCRIEPYKEGNTKRIRSRIEYVINRKGAEEKVSREVEFSLMTGSLAARLKKASSKAGLIERLEIRDLTEILEGDIRQVLWLRKESALFISQLASLVNRHEPDMNSLRIKSKCPECENIQLYFMPGSTDFLFPHMI